MKIRGRKQKMKIQAKPGPFLRWAGGKNWFTKHLDEVISKTEYCNYHEPFLGGGSVFFSLLPNNISFLSDVNDELINTYLMIKNSPNEVFEELSSYENSEKVYYLIRAIEDSDNVKRAARFIYLNQTSYNGLYRVNKKGKYNVPYGHRKTAFLDKDRLLLASFALRNTVIENRDFMSSLQNIQRNDLVFLDPPYTVSHNNNGFIEYNKNLFSLNDQYRLSVMINEIKNREAYYILTNAGHEKIIEIFDKGDKFIKLERTSAIGGRNSKRGSIEEYVFTNIIEEVNL